MNTVEKLLVDLAKARGLTPPKPKVLVVDDNENYARILAEVLEGEGFDVLIASSPQEAVADITKTIPFKRIYLDLEFSGNQSTAADVLKQIETTMPQLPVTIVSGHMDGRDKEIASKAKELGLNVTVYSKLDGFDKLLKLIKSDCK